MKHQPSNQSQFSPLPLQITPKLHINNLINPSHKPHINYLLLLVASLALHSVLLSFHLLLFQFESTSMTILSLNFWLSLVPRYPLPAFPFFLSPWLSPPPQWLLLVPCISFHSAPQIKPETQQQPSHLYLFPLPFLLLHERVPLTMSKISI